MIITIDLIHQDALNLLQDMERRNLIRVNASAGSPTVSRRKPSDSFAGALHLSDEQYTAFQNNLREIRTEWKRDIYEIPMWLLDF